MQRRVGVVDPSRAFCRSTDLAEGGTEEDEGKKRVVSTGISQCWDRKNRYVT